ncbi:MAG TPA: peroxiredoxin [Oceanospirillales bacterium]|nr:peroxiredoxin [Oceanospirillales bacterium]
MKKLLFTLSILLQFNTSIAADWQGQKAPEFDLPDQNGVFHTLKDYQGKWLVLYFYPKDDTPGCTIEAKSFTTDYKAIEALGAVVVGASLDDIASHKEFAAKYNIPYTLLADKDEIMATAYKVVKKIPLMHYAKRQTFIIDPQGIIAKFYADVSPSSHTQQVITDLKQLQQSLDNED